MALALHVAIAPAQEKLVARIIPILKQKGFRFVTVRELF